jgi:hypothetical protein
MYYLLKNNSPGNIVVWENPAYHVSNRVFFKTVLYSGEPHTAIEDIAAWLRKSFPKGVTIQELYASGFIIFTSGDYDKILETAALEAL